MGWLAAHLGCASRLKRTRRLRLLWRGGSYRACRDAAMHAGDVRLFCVGGARERPQFRRAKLATPRGSMHCRMHNSRRQSRARWGSGGGACACSFFVCVLTSGRRDNEYSIASAILFGRDSLHQLPIFGKRGAPRKSGQGNVRVTFVPTRI